ncbi:tyrosine-type recombinase/integrase [Candidatus Sumerlaeota bacterium]|nr:tyrosine-type recombinase/integrase [Candidatus Sumerlaeota bacterium]
MLQYLEWAKEHQSYIVSVIALSGCAGLRILESCYIREQDIDFDLKTVRITSVEPYHVPKTLRSHRTIPVGDFVLDQLRWAIEHRAGKRHRGFISVSPKTGEPWTVDQQHCAPCQTMRRYLAKHAPKGTPRITSRNLRTSFISHARMVLGINPLALRMYVGHTDGSVLEDHYTWWSVEFLRREVVEKAEGWVGKSECDSPHSSDSSRASGT